MQRQIPNKQVDWTAVAATHVLPPLHFLQSTFLFQTLHHKFWDKNIISESTSVGTVNLGMMSSMRFQQSDSIFSKSNHTENGQRSYLLKGRVLQFVWFFHSFFYRRWVGVLPKQTKISAQLVTDWAGVGGCRRALSAQIRGRPLPTHGNCHNARLELFQFVMQVYHIRITYITILLSAVFPSLSENGEAAQHITGKPTSPIPLFVLIHLPHKLLFLNIYLFN